MLQPKQETRFEYKGFPCVVLFMPIGYRCGYVGLPNHNKYYKKKYDDIPVDCHCGLTYSEHGLFGQNDNDTWWIGFDCGHFCDGLDSKSFHLYYDDDLETMDPKYRKPYMFSLERMFDICSEYPVRTQEYVENECRKIVDQIVGGGASDRTIDSSSTIRIDSFGR